MQRACWRQGRGRPGRQGCGSGTALGRIRMGAFRRASASPKRPLRLFRPQDDNLRRSSEHATYSTLHPRAPRTDIHGVVVVVHIQDIRQRDDGERWGAWSNSLRGVLPRPVTFTCKTPAWVAIPAHAIRHAANRR